MSPIIAKVRGRWPQASPPGRDLGQLAGVLTRPISQLCQRLLRLEHLEPASRRCRWDGSG